MKNKPQKGAGNYSNELKHCLRLRVGAETRVSGVQKSTVLTSTGKVHLRQKYDILRSDSRVFCWYGVYDCEVHRLK